MTAAPHPELPASARIRAHELIKRSGRALLGLVGPPGSGKSTLAAALQAEFASAAQVVPMDGFHLANVELERLGRRDRKGAPDTFDSAGYVALMRRLLAQADDEIVYAPSSGARSRSRSPTRFPSSRAPS